MFNYKMTLFLLIFTFWTSFSYSQKEQGYPSITFEIDTLLIKNDTSNLFVREIWDTTVVKFYYASIDSIDKTIHYGFLNLKKGKIRKYFLKNIREVQWYPRPFEYQGYRGPDGYPAVLFRLY